MQKVLGIERNTEKILNFYLAGETNAKVGDMVVLELEDFVTLGKVKRVYEEPDDSKVSELPKISAIATSKEIETFNEYAKKAKEMLPQIKKKSLELGLTMKFVSAEYSLDGGKILIVFSSEERVDFRQLLKDLAAMLKVRIELKQIGQRDEVKVCGGVGPCGEPCCCARFLKDFEHVSVKMAKIQGLSLSPTKINGLCGRLMCCLGYESPTYEQILATMPKIGEEVVTANGSGTVVYNDILRERVSVRRQSEGDTAVVEDFALDEIVFGDKLNEYKKHPEKFNLKKKEETKQKSFDEKLNNVLGSNKDDGGKGDGEANQNSNAANKHENYGEHNGYKGNENVDKNLKENWRENKFNNKNFNSKPSFNGKNRRDEHDGNKQNGKSEKYGIIFQSVEDAEREAQTAKVNNHTSEGDSFHSNRKFNRKRFSSKNRHNH